jgi:hypothetical protein
MECMPLVHGGFSQSVSAETLLDAVASAMTIWSMPGLREKR